MNDPQLTASRTGIPKQAKGPRLLYVVSEDWYFLMHRLSTALAAQNAGFDVHVATRVVSSGDVIRQHGFSLHAISFVRGKLNWSASLRTIMALRQVLRDVDPAITHHVSLQSIVLASLASPAQHVARVNSFTGLGQTFLSSGVKTLALRAVITTLMPRLLNRPRTVAVVENPDDGAMLASIGIESSRIVLIPGSGVDITRFQPAAEPPGPVTVAFVGRLIETKGIRTLIEAHRLLRQRGSNIALFIVGAPDPGNPSSISALEAASWANEGGISMLGHVDDITPLWKRAAIAVLPSWREGLPMSLLEAAACGRPLVATDVPGCREIVIPGETGLLVPRGDPAALADAIQTLADLPELRARYGAAARRLAVERFSAQNVGRQTVDLYRSLMR